MSTRQEWEQALSWEPMPLGTRAIALLLATYADETGKAEVTIGLLARITRLSRLVVKGHLGTITKAGWLERVTVGTDDHGDRTGTLWALTVPERHTFNGVHEA